MGSYYQENHFTRFECCFAEEFLHFCLSIRKYFLYHALDIDALNFYREKNSKIMKKLLKSASNRIITGQSCVHLADMPTIV